MRCADPRALTGSNEQRATVRDSPPGPLRDVGVNCLADPYVPTPEPLRTWSRFSLPPTSRPTRSDEAKGKAMHPSITRMRRFGFAAAAFALAVAMLGTT